MGSSGSGSGGTTTLQAPVTFPAGYGFAEGFFNQVAPQLLNQGLPTFPGRVDPGYSPSMSSATQMAQGMAEAPLPSIWGGAQDTLARFMQPKMADVGWGMSQPAPSFFSGGGFPGAPGSGGGGRGGMMDPMMMMLMGMGSGYGSPVFSGIDPVGYPGFPGLDSMRGGGTGSGGPRVGTGGGGGGGGGGNPPPGGFTKKSCEAAGGRWNGSDCEFKLNKPPKHPGGKQKCEEDGGIWVNGGCIFQGPPTL